MKYFYTACMALCLFLLAGCEIVSDTRDRTLNDVMDSWVGSDESRLVASWGAPTQVYHNRDGSTVLTWKQYRETSDTYGYCVKTFVSDSQGIVRKWGYSFCSYYVNGKEPIDQPIPKPTI